jgi:hypothetical protein
MRLVKEECEIAQYLCPPVLLFACAHRRRREGHRTLEVSERDPQTW